MASKIFVTGVTGYIGGDAFVALYKAHPEYDYTLLVRNEQRAQPVKAAFSGAKNIRYVYGTSADVALIATEAGSADVVLHTGNSADDGPAAKALAEGVAKAHKAGHPGVFIHISGSGVIATDIIKQRFGQDPLPEETYDDLEGVSRVLNDLPDAALHRDVDKIVIAAAAAYPHTLRVAIVSPPTIYGQGRGPVNTRSIQIPDMAEYALTVGHAPVVEGPGVPIWDNIHVADLSALLVRLVEAGLAPQERDNAQIFGSTVYYFVENGHPHKWADVAKAVQAAATKQGLRAKETGAPLVLKTVPVTAVFAAGVPNTHGANASWGTNARGDAKRARALLGWAAKEGSLEEAVPETVAAEAKRLGLAQ